MLNKRILNNLLRTTSVIALSSFGTDALATSTVYVLNGGNASLSAATGFHQDGATASIPVDLTLSPTIYFGAASSVLTLDTPGTISNSLTLDAFGNSGETIAITKNINYPITLQSTITNYAPHSDTTSAQYIASQAYDKTNTSLNPGTMTSGNFNINFNSDFSATIADGENYIGAITTSTTNTGALTFDNAPSNPITVGSVGTHSNSLGTINIGDSTHSSNSVTSTGSTYVNNLNFNNTGQSFTASGGGYIGSVTPNSNSDSTLSITDSASSNITTTIGPIGSSGSVGNLKSLTLGGSGSSTVVVNGDIYSSTITLNQDQYNFTKRDATLTGNVTTTDGAVLYLGSNNLTITGSLTLPSSSTTTIKADVSNGTVASKVIVSGGITNPSSLTIDLGSGSAPIGYSNVSFIKAQNIGSAASSINVISSNDLINWVVVGTDPDNIGLSTRLTARGLTNQLQQAGLSPNSTQFIQKLANANSGDAAKFLSFVTNAPPATAAEAVNRVATPSASHAIASVGAANSAISGRMTEVAIGESSEEGYYGVSSGDDSYYSDEPSTSGTGLWIEGVSGKASQKQYKTNPGFTSTSSGGIVGVDTFVSDRSLLGFGISSSESNIKYKDAKAGDKSKLTDLSLNLYMKSDLRDNTFVQGIVSAGSSTTSSKSRRVTGVGTYDIASGSYNTKHYGLEFDFGYKSSIATNTNLVPTVGVSYNKFLDKSYQETGSSTNLTVTQKNHDHVVSIMGLRLENKSHLWGGVLNSEVHATANYDLKPKAPVVKATIQGLDGSFDISPSNPTKLSMEYGIGFNMKYGNVSYGLSYLTKSADKYSASQGSVKLRVDL